MKTNSWKTTLAGILLVGMAICKYFKIDLPYDEILPILTGIGLGLSKDYNVSSNIDKNTNK